MKRNLLLSAIVLALSCTHAIALERDQSEPPTSGAISNSSANAGALALASSGAYNSTGSTYVNVSENQNDHIIPANSAIAPNIVTSVICPIVSPTSHAVQFLIFGGSTTGSQSLNGICVAYHLGQTDVIEKMACNKDKEYAKANPNCEK